MSRSWRLLGRTVAAVAVALLLAPGAQAQLGALRLLLLTYEGTCAADLVPGATALPPGGGEEAPR